MHPSEDALDPTPTLRVPTDPKCRHDAEPCCARRTIRVTARAAPVDLLN
jgi:hypothetical protein